MYTHDIASMFQSGSDAYYTILVIQHDAEHYITHSPTYLYTNAGTNQALVHTHKPTTKAAQATMATKRKQASNVQ